MSDAYIISATRTPVGRAHKGGLAGTRPDDLAALVIREAIDRAGVDAAKVDDVVLGCATPEAEQGLNIARMASLQAGVSHDAAALTLNRFCASGLEAIHYAASRIKLGEADIVVAGGVESMSMIPMGGNKIAPNPGIVGSHPEFYITMGLTAERVAARYEVSREEQDQFALSSHEKALAAIDAGRFEDEIVSVPVRTPVLQAGGKVQVVESEFTVDECPRRGSSLEALAKLKPVFVVGGTVTAGNSSPVNDGAAAVVVVSEKVMKKLGATPLGRFVGFATAGVDPEVMGIGPVLAVPRVLKQTGIKLDDIGLIELNEAFASQSVYVLRELGIPDEKVNVNGGAIALGHPLGCTGAKLTATLLYEMQRRDERYGIVTMCVGGGMGAAGVFERMS